jgi:hypothetical protein
MSATRKKSINMTISKNETAVLSGDVYRNFVKYNQEIIEKITGDPMA